MVYRKRKRYKKQKGMTGLMLGRFLFILLLIMILPKIPEIEQQASDLQLVEEQQEEATTQYPISTTNATCDAAKRYKWFASVPEYRGTPYIEINNDIPFFTNKEKKNRKAFEKYANLDKLGRCGTAYANICEELMPTEERESISNIQPSGWHQKYYNNTPAWNRCHLIGFQLAGENDNEKNLITGTRSFNVKGMLPFENTVAQYIYDNPSNHVLYRVTPIYRNKDDLLAYGVLMEAWSVEDNGYECQFNVFVYNAQDGVKIDYSTGENWEA